ncbi:MAG: hypothetical protein ACREB3_01440 [Burkholderiales bacterium]
MSARQAPSTPEERQFFGPFVDPVDAFGCQLRFRRIEAAESALEDGSPERAIPEFLSASANFVLDEAIAPNVSRLTHINASFSQAKNRSDKSRA